MMRSKAVIWTFFSISTNKQTNKQINQTTETQTHTSLNPKSFDFKDFFDLVNNPLFCKSKLQSMLSEY